MNWLKFFLVFFFVCNTSFAATTYREALRQAKTENKYFFVIFKATWCGPCKQFEEETIQPLMPQLEKFCVVYEVDIDKEKDIAAKFSRVNKPWNLEVLPTYYLSTKDKKYFLRKGVGFRTRSEFAKWFSGR